MTQLNPDRYVKIGGGGATYGSSDGLYFDKTNTLLVMVIGGTVVMSLDASGTILAGALEAPDLSVSGQTRGDILRRGEAAWERHVALTSGQVLLGDGTDVKSTALSGDVTVNGSGVTAIGATKVLASMLGANLGKGYLPLDISTAKIISGDAIGNTTEGLFPDGNTAPSLARVNAATDKALRLIWASSSSIEVQFPPIIYPPDLDDAAAVEVHLLATMAGATDTPTIAVGYFEGVGDTNAGGNTAALSASVAELTVSIAAGDVGTHPKAATICLTPGAHTTDALWLYGAWVEYTRKS